MAKEAVNTEAIGLLDRAASLPISEAERKAVER